MTGREAVPGEYLRGAREGLRRARPWHPLAFIVREMPVFLERLARQLEVRHSGRVLDYGSADAPYRGFFPASVEFVTADLSGNAEADLAVDGDGTLPLPSESFDAVISTQVLEHVPDPDVYLAECHRVLRPGGRMLLSTHGMFRYHPDPTDYWRWTADGLRRVVAQAGFEVLAFEGFVGMTATGLQLAQDGVYHRLPRVVRPAFALVMQGLIRLAERFQTPAGRAQDALVFALVAQRPTA